MLNHKVLFSMQYVSPFIEPERIETWFDGVLPILGCKSVDRV